MPTERKGEKKKCKKNDEEEEEAHARERKNNMRETTINGRPALEQTAPSFPMKKLEPFLTTEYGTSSEPTPTENT